MRALLMVFGVIFVGLAGLWFLTPVLDQPYSRHAPGIAKSRQIAASPSAAGSRASGPSAGRPSSSGSVIGSKALTDNVMSMINAVTGLLGLWFGWMSYRLQKREFDRPR